MADRRLVKELEPCQEPDDSDIVEAILKGLFANKLPAVLATKKIADTTRANAFAYVRALRLLTLSDLEELGILRGEARMVLAAITATDEAAPAENND